nr:MAG TPA: PROTEIN-plastocyanin oxido-reductase Cytochrome b6f Photosynthesis [Caudoviricetes sp.]
MEKIKLPQVFDGKRRISSYVSVDREEFNDLVECSRKVEKAMIAFERVTICVGLIVVGIVIGMVLL